MKNKTTAALLAFFLGCFGVQWFYLGKSGRGIAYLLMFWLLIWTFVVPIIIGILCFIEFIQFLTMSDEEFNLDYNTAPNLSYQNFSQPQYSASQNTPNKNISVNNTASKADSLLKLKSLLDNGVLTQEEYDNQKRNILNQ